jgi:Tol biopolymer transport system component
MEGKAAAKLLALLAGSALVAVGVSAATTTATPVAVKATTRNEVTPAASGIYFAWAKSRRGHPRVFDVFAQQEGQAGRKVNARNTYGWAGGIDGTRLVYQQVKKGNSDIRFFDLVTRRRTNAPQGVNSKRWEWAPSISGDWLMFGRGVVFGSSTQMVVLRNLVTGEQRVLDSLRSRTGFTQAGQVNGNYAVWMKCAGRSTCNVYRYDITTATTTIMPATGQQLYGPSVSPSGAVFYGRSGSGCGERAELVKTTLDGVTTVLYSFSSGQDFVITYTTQVVSVPPPPFTTNRIYFDRIICSSRRYDIYSIDDAERLPPS